MIWQGAVKRNDDYSVFRYHMVCNFELKQELRTHGAKTEVLAPAWLRDEFARDAEELRKMYERGGKG